MKKKAVFTIYGFTIFIIYRFGECLEFTTIDVRFLKQLLRCRRRLLKRTSVASQVARFVYTCIYHSPAEHGVEGFIATKGEPVHARAQHLPTDKLVW